LFWFGIFTLATFGVIDPNFTTYIANLMGIGRGSDIVIYVSIMMLFYLIFRINVYIENIRHDITKLVREIGMLKHLQDDQKKPRNKK